MAEPNGDKLIENQPYDESVEVSDGEEVPSTNHTPLAPPHTQIEPFPQQALSHPPQPHPPPAPQPTQTLRPHPPTEPFPPQTHASENQPAQFYPTRPHPPPAQPPKSQHQMEYDVAGGGATGGRGGGGRVQGGMQYEEEDSEGEGSESEESESDDNRQQAHTGVYDPADYNHLQVSSETKELFRHITRYTPQAIELETQLRPFIPEYIPAIGDIDAFLKVTRPDGKTETAGMLVVDEPRAKQSDPTVLDLQLRTLTKQTTVKPVTVHSIEDPDKDGKAMDNWIESIGEIHRQKPPTTVHYTKNMPDVEDLMQEWPAEFEEALKELGLPTADLDCDLAQYTDIICALLDIPVFNSRIHSLHNLFSLYMEFKDSQHFKHDEPTVDAEPPSQSAPTDQ